MLKPVQAPRYTPHLVLLLNNFLWEPNQMNRSRGNERAQVIFNVNGRALVPAQVLLGSEPLSEGHPDATFSRAIRSTEDTDHQTDTSRS